jgi:ParB-like chromosome segregation protein Spo0J
MRKQTKAKTKAKPAKKMRQIEADGVTVYCAHVAIVPIGDVKPNPRNPNRHPDAQVAMLAKIIKAQGWRAPITVSARSGFVVKGHARLAAAALLGVKSVPVDVQHYASPEAETADMIADNRIAELAEIDPLGLKDLLQELDTGALDMELTGYTLPDIEQLMNQYHVEPADAPKLKDGDRAPFRQATFTLHDEQWGEVEAAIAKAKKDGGGESAVNENRNGNALAWICRAFNGGRNG